MNETQILKLTGKMMLLIWLKNLISSEDADISKNNWNVIELRNNPTSLIAFGRRTENNTPIISVEQSLVGFFFSYNIMGVYIDAKGRVYIAYGYDVPLFVLKLSSSNKRSFLLTTEHMKERAMGHTVDFYAHNINEGRVVDLTRPLHRTHVRLINSINDILPEDKETKYEYSSLIDDQYDGEFNLEDPENFTNFLDPL